MKSWVRKSIKVGVLAAGFLLATGTNAQAATDVIAVDNDGVANGTQAVVPIQAPINVCGVGVGVAGDGFGLADCDATAIANGGKRHGKPSEAANLTKYQPRHAAPEYAQESGDTIVSAGNDGILNGNQVYIPIQAPINACGIGIGALGGQGAGYAKCDATAKRESGGDITAISADNDGILNGNQVIIPLQLPVNACGIGVGALGGQGQGQADCTATATTGKEKKKPGYESARTPELLPLGGLTSGLPLGGVTSGLPLAGGAGGDMAGMFAGDAMGAPAAAGEQMRKPRHGGENGGGDITAVSADNDGILNGNQVIIPVQLPINVCGVGVGVGGSGTGIAKCDATAKR